MQDEGLEVDLVQLYVARAVGSSYYKIGRARDLAGRMRQILTFIPFDLKVVLALKCFRYCSWPFEAKLQRQFRRCRVRGEWYALSNTDLNLIREVLFPQFIRFMVDQRDVKFMDSRRVMRHLDELIIQ